MIYLTIFFFASVFFTMVGFGGGSVYVPVFKFMGYNLKEFAIPSAIFLIFLSSAAAVSNYFKHKLVNISVGVFITIVTTISAFISKIYFFDNVSPKFLWLMLGIIITVIGVKMYLPETKIRISLKTNLSKKIYYSFIGIIVGFLSITIGFGGGSIMVPLLILSGFDIKVAIGTSSFIIMATSFANSLVHFFTTFDRSHTGILFIVSIFVIAGGYVGSKLTSVKMSKKNIRLVMATLLTGLGLYILFTK